MEILHALIFAMVAYMIIEAIRVGRNTAPSPEAQNIGHASSTTAETDGIDAHGPEETQNIPQDLEATTP